MTQTFLMIYHGSPAWAGIDPTIAEISKTKKGFPRVGGDRPLSGRVALIARLVPPRGRG